MPKIDKKSLAFKIAVISALVSFISFGYKLTLGIITASMVLIIASISALMVFICKLMFVRNTTKTKEQKKKAYFIMTIAATVFVALFVLFSVLKVGGIDTSNQKTYSGWAGALFILFILIMFVLSVIKLRGALEKNDLVFKGLKEMTFISALTDVVIIMEFIYRIVRHYIEDVNIVRIVRLTNNYSSIAVSVFMIIVVVSMFKRSLGYNKD